MVRDLNDAWSWLERIVRRIDRLESGAMLENSSITGGRMRFIGGLLRIDSGGQIQVIGEWRFTGTGAITGDVVAEGKWTQNGPWEFNGPGDIDGDVDVTGTIRVLGDGRIQVGNIIIDPSANGGVIKVGAHSIYVNGAAMTILHSGGAQVVLNNGGVSLTKGGTSFTVGDAGISVGGVSSQALSGAPAGALWRNGSGELRVAS